ncbi:MAG: dihydroorotase [Firmicutes bacterium]|jgi:dihydroorotase|nr:dihydroorotase [Bacillota bacterium]
MSLLIKGGRVIDPAGGIDARADVLIEGGQIVKVGADLPAAKEEIQAEGLVVAPGFIDLHVHLREPGFEYKETIASGTRAAARGGFTSVVCMPNTNPPVDSRAVVEFILAEAARSGAVRVYPIGTITKGRRGEELTEMADLAAAGVVAFSDDGSTVMNAAVMRRALEYGRMLDLPLSLHCEDVNLAGHGLMNEGRMSTLLGLPGQTRAAESVIIARDVELARVTGGRIHVAHVSTKESVDLIRRAKEQGLKISAEATPHHLTLTEELVATYDPNTKVSPPLRTREDVEALRAGLRDGTIDCIATDHAPHSRDDKDVEYAHAAWGMVGLETAWPVIYTHLVLTGCLSLIQAIDLFTRKPASVFNLPGGRIGVGQPADLVLFDPNRKLQVTEELLVGKSKNSPFIGQELQGWPVYTIVGGQVKWVDESWR